MPISPAFPSEIQIELVIFFGTNADGEPLQTEPLLFKAGGQLLLRALLRSGTMHFMDPFASGAAGERGLVQLLTTK